MNRYILTVLVANQVGVLTKIATLFSGRGCNIHAMTAYVTDNQTGVSRITIEVLDQSEKIHQIYYQIDKLEDVIDVSLLEEVSKNKIQR